MKVVHTPRTIVVSKNEFEVKYIEAANENDVLRARIAALEKENAELKKIVDQGIKVELVGSSIPISLAANSSTQTITPSIEAASSTVSELVPRGKVIDTIREFIARFVEWFNETVFNIPEFAENAKELLIQDLNTNDFILFVKEIIQKFKKILKLKAYIPLEEAIERCEKEINSENKQDEMMSMIMNIMNEMTKLKEDVNSKLTNMKGGNGLRSSVKELTSSFEKQAPASDGRINTMEEKIRRLEIEVRTLKNKK
jgi:predicted metal-dependent hydrolase